MCNKIVAENKLHTEANAAAYFGLVLESKLGFNETQNLATLKLHWLCNFIEYVLL